LRVAVQVNSAVAADDESLGPGVASLDLERCYLCGDAAGQLLGAEEPATRFDPLRERLERVPVP
jgi:hypothetical protein